MDDTQMHDVLNETGTDGEPVFSDEEQEILDLYDQAQTLELELALTKARVRLAGSLPTPIRDHTPPILTTSIAGETSSAPPADSESDNDNGPDDPQALAASRAQLLEAMALCRLRDTVATGVLTANPILKGLHSSTYASPVEQDLAPWLHARDRAAQHAARQSGALRDALDRLAEAEAEGQRAARRNRALAAEVLRLAREADRGREAALADDERVRAQVEALEERLRVSRQKWRVIKGTTSGIVAGSGVDWAGDEVLRDLVLDPE